MDTQDKIIASILLIHSSFGILWTCWVAANMGFPVVFIGTNLLLAATGIVAGLGLFKNWLWASFFGIVFFLVQLIHVFTPTFQWSFTLGFGINIMLGWLGAGALGVNLFALLMLGWLSARTFLPDNAPGPNPPGSPA
ncbi:MAG: hypothetical protein ABIW82_11475 [Dokdonella sp.]